MELSKLKVETDQIVVAIIDKPTKVFHSLNTVINYLNKQKDCKSCIVGMKFITQNFFQGNVVFEKVPIDTKEPKDNKFTHAEIPFGVKTKWFIYLGIGPEDDMQYCFYSAKSSIMEAIKEIEKELRLAKATAHEIANN